MWVLGIEAATVVDAPEVPGKEVTGRSDNQRAVAAEVHQGQGVKGYLTSESSDHQELCGQIQTAQCGPGLVRRPG